MKNRREQKVRWKDYGYAHILCEINWTQAGHGHVRYNPLVFMVTSCRAGTFACVSTVKYDNYFMFLLVVRRRQQCCQIFAFKSHHLVRFKWSADMDKFSTELLQCFYEIEKLMSNLTIHKVLSHKYSNSECLSCFRANCWTRKKNLKQIILTSNKLNNWTIKINKL